MPEEIDINENPSTFYPFRKVIPLPNPNFILVIWHNSDGTESKWQVAQKNQVDTLGNTTTHWFERATFCDAKEFFYYMYTKGNSFLEGI